MKFSMIFISVLLACAMISCNDEPTSNGDELPIYSITINSPSTEELPIGESFDIHVDFDEENALTIHNIDLQITNDNGEVIYNEPSLGHVQEDSGHYEFHDDFVLDVEAGTTLRLTAKVWGHIDGFAEVTETTTFTAQ